MFGLKEILYPGSALIRFWNDNKNFLQVLEILQTFQFCSFWLLAKFGNIAIKLKFYLLGNAHWP